MVTEPLSPAVPSRVHLEGVPRVEFFQGRRCPEDVPFPSCLRASLGFLGDAPACRHTGRGPGAWGLDCGYAYLMAASGAAFRLLWNPEQWDMANGDIMVMAPDAVEPLRRGFQSVGYSFEVLGKPDGAGLEAVFRARIVESLRDRGRPVIAFGVVGPPECCLVTGYDEGGDVLIGWSFFQGSPEFTQGVEFEPSGEFRRRGWYSHTPGLILIGEKGERPPLRQVQRDALEWGLQVMRTPRVNHRHAGLAAYTAWADALGRDDDFRADDAALLRDRYIVHFDATGTVAEGRWYAALFLSQMATYDHGASEHLWRAAACLKIEHDLMWSVWNLAGGNGVSDAHARKLSEPGTRRQMIPVILQARAQEQEAAEHLDRALACLK